MKAALSRLIPSVIALFCTALRLNNSFEERDLNAFTLLVIPIGELSYYDRRCKSSAIMDTCKCCYRAVLSIFFWLYCVVKSCVDLINFSFSDTNKQNSSIVLLKSFNKVWHSEALLWKWFPSSLELAKYS